MIHDAETKIRNKTDEELDLFIEELEDARAQRGYDEMDEYLLGIAEDEKAKRSS